MRNTKENEGGMHVNTTCKNCNTEFEGDTCPNCGSKKEDLQPDILTNKSESLKTNETQGNEKDTEPNQTNANTPSHAHDEASTSYVKPTKKMKPRVMLEAVGGLLIIFLLFSTLSMVPKSDYDKLKKDYK